MPSKVSLFTAYEPATFSLFLLRRFREIQQRSNLLDFTVSGTPYLDAVLTECPSIFATRLDGSAIL